MVPVGEGHNKVNSRSALGDKADKGGRVGSGARPLVLLRQPQQSGPQRIEVHVGQRRQQILSP